jgi:hypothetical protein
MQALPIYRLPLDVAVNPPAPPAAPDGTLSPVVLTSDAPMRTLGPADSNRVIDLNGFEITDLVFGPGYHHGRVTNGRVGTFRSQNLHSLTPEAPNEVTDLTIDNLLCTGRGPRRAGNQFRAQRFLISDIKTVAARARDGGDGFEAFALWLDPGTCDGLVQDSNLWTWGEEACYRAMSTQRVVVANCVLGTIAEKHTLRVHGTDYIQDLDISRDNGVYDCVLRRRGMMIATMPDSTQYRPDVSRRFVAKRVLIDMNMDGGPGVDAALGLPRPTLTPDGRVRLLGCLMQDVTIRTDRWNPWPNIFQIDTDHPEYNWTFTNCNYRRAT